MNTDHLRIFSEVADLLSFAAVAEKHEVNPSSISRIISQLEDELGARLFHRSTRRMRLTEAGDNFQQRIKGILDELEDAELCFFKDISVRETLSQNV